MYPFHWIADPWNFIYIRALSARQIDLRSFTKTWTIYQLWWLHTQSYLEKMPEKCTRKWEIRLWKPAYVWNAKVARASSDNASKISLSVVNNAHSYQLRSTAFNVFTRATFQQKTVFILVWVAWITRIVRKLKKN